MVSLANLKFLASQKAKDAETLLRNNRNAGAIYMMGYALEFSLKRKISQTIGFNHGFPENNAEFRLYSVQLSAFIGSSTGIPLTHISQIHNHKLADLLAFSGAQYRIVSNFINEWQTVSNWNPEHRYVRQRVTGKRAESFLFAAKTLLR